MQSPMNYGPSNFNAPLQSPRNFVPRSQPQGVFNPSYPATQPPAPTPSSFMFPGLQPADAQVTAGAQLVFCVCGTVFEPGWPTCTRCGQPRPQAQAQPSAFDQQVMQDLQGQGANASASVASKTSNLIGGTTAKKLNFRQLSPQGPNVPTLYRLNYNDYAGSHGEDMETLHFDVRNVMVLYALAEQTTTWNQMVQAGRLWTPVESQRIVFDLINEGSAANPLNGNQQELSLAGFDAFLANVDLRHVIDDRLPIVSEGIQNKDVRRDALLAFDTDKNGSLSFEEFSTFLYVIMIMTQNYLLQMALVNRQAFYGRWGKNGSYENMTVQRDLSVEVLLDHLGKSVTTELGADDTVSDSPTADYYGPYDSAREQTMPLSGFGGDSAVAGKAKLGKWKFVHERRMFQCFLDEGWFASEGERFTGWTHDLYYYAANNHALLSIFLHDASHRLSSPERIVMEATTIALTLGGADLLNKIDGFLGDPGFQNTPTGSLLMTLIGMLIYQSLYMLFTCPCGGMVNELVEDESKRVRAKRLTQSGEIIGYAMIIGAFVLLGIQLLSETQNTGRWGWELLLVFGFRLRAYFVVTPLLYVFITFNPYLVIFGQPNPDKPRTIADKLLGLGQWKLEKQRFQWRCMEALNQLGKKQEPASPAWKNYKLQELQGAWWMKDVRRDENALSKVNIAEPQRDAFISTNDMQEIESLLRDPTRDANGQLQLENGPPRDAFLNAKGAMFS